MPEPEPEIDRGWVNPWMEGLVQTIVRHGILPFEIEITASSDGVTAHGGLPLVLETMRALGMDKSIERNLHLREREGGYSETEKVEALVLLLAAGGDCFDDIDVLKADTGLGRLLGRTLPSAAVLRRFTYEFHDDALIEAAKLGRPQGAVAYIPAENAALQGLDRVNTDLVRAVAARGKGKRATLDHDATVIESHKALAQPHYKGGVGYQPAVIYWAEQDLALADEYRDGNVPAGMANLPLIQRGFAVLSSGIEHRFFRGDSACYETPVLKWLADDERKVGLAGRIGFSISADMTKELQNVCKAVPETQWELCQERADETVMCADVEFAPGDWSKDADPLRYVALRIKKKQGRLFASGYDTKYLAVVSNRRELCATELITWHWQKAGTIEQLHDVMKNELAAGTPPCGRFGANAAWNRLSLITYNVLSAMKSLALPPTMSTARPKRLRFAVLNLAARISSHAGTLWMRLGEQIEATVQMVTARLRLLALLPLAGAG